MGLGIYSETHTLLTRDCDAFGRLRPGIMMEFLQEAAGTQCAQLGMGRFDLMDQGLVWVVTRLTAQAERWPELGETITVTTWHHDMHHAFYPRSFTIADKNGEIRIRISSLWILMDIRTRTMIRSGGQLLTLPESSGMPPALPMPKAPEEAENGAPVPGSLVPQYTDFDANRHVNNTRYIDWCCNALGMETMEKNDLKTFRVQYDHEVTAGTTVDTVLRRDGAAFSYTGTVNGERAFAVSGTLEKKETGA